MAGARGKNAPAADSPPLSEVESECQENKDGKWITCEKKKRNKRTKEQRDQNESTSDECTCKGMKDGKVCNKPVMEEGVECEICEHWFHVGCAGMGKAAYQAIEDYGLPWMCEACRGFIPQFKTVVVGKLNVDEKKQLEGLEKRLENIQEEMSKNTEKIMQAVKNHADSEQSCMQAGSATYAEALKQAVVEKLDEKLKNTGYSGQDSEVIKQSAEEIRKLVQIKEKEKRQNNIIIHNIQESNSRDPAERKKYDETGFCNMMYELLGYNVELVEIFRLGKKTTSDEGHQKPRLMMAKLKYKEDVDLLIKHRTLLKEVGYPNVYLTKDLSPEERAIEKTLRDELIKKGKDNHVIFRGKVVPRR